MARLSRLAVVAALLALTPSAGALLPTPAEGIGPGSHLILDFDGVRFGCTGGWLFTDAAGAHYLSTAGHCLLDDFETSTHGADADVESSPRIEVCVDRCVFGGQTGFVLEGRTVEIGPVAYARQRAGGEAIGSDFGLIAIPQEHVARLRPGMPEFGEAVRTSDVQAGDLMCYYGAGMVTGETFVTMPREAVGVSGFGPSFRMAGLSNIGDSGAAVMECSPDGRGLAASGILTHLSGGLIAGTSMARARQLAQVDAGLRITPYLG